MKAARKQMMVNAINHNRKIIIRKQRWAFLILCLITSIGVMLTSCTEDDDMTNAYIDDGTGILIEVQDQFDAMTTRAAYEGFPATTFEEGDEIGIYALNGTTVVSSNIKFTKQADGSWTPASKVVYNPDYTYYAYFPYVSSTPSFANTASGEEGKFANFISSSTFLLNDQSTKVNFTKSNLMTAQGTVFGTRTVKFTMLHKRGLAVIGDAVNKWYYTDADGTKYEMAPVFTTYIPYKMGDKYYYLMKPNTATTVGGLSLRAGAGKYMTSNGAEISSVTSWQYRTSTNLGSSWGSWSSSKPSWLTITTNVVDDEPTEFIVTTTNSTSTTTSKGSGMYRNVAGDATLKAATSVSNIDLSMVNNDGTPRSLRTTANCYLVHAPGTYKLPLVYGNAIKDGDESSTSSFYTTQTSNTLQRLLNHANQGITSPWIKDNTTDGTTKISIGGGKLIWEDVEGLIKQSSIGVSGDFLTFEVDADNIAEGNAVIAATTGAGGTGDVVWSWHIWVTSETLSDGRLTSIDTGGHTNLSGASAPYRVAPVNIGQVNGTITSGATIYAGDLCQVRATGNGVTLEFQVTAKDYISGGTTRYYPSPYFQWGRKDAMYPSTGGYNASGTLVNSYTSGTTLITATTTTPGTTIQHPDIWYYNSSNYSPYGTSYSGKRNFWDMNQIYADNISTATIKTVYDPCPPGFCVPTGNLFCFMGNMLSNPTSSGNRSDSNWTSNQGKTWSASTYSSSTTGPDLFFPASGCRNSSGGSLSGVGSYGYYWSASAYGSNTNTARNLTFKSGDWDWGNSPRSYGFPVRAVAEE